MTYLHGKPRNTYIYPMQERWNVSNAGCTLSPSAFGKSLGLELPEMRLGECDSLHSCRELSNLACDTRRQPGETLWLVHHRPLKKWYLNEARHERRGYTRGCKARWVFPSTFSLSPCLVFPRWECTASITLQDTRR